MSPGLTYRGEWKDGKKYGEGMQVDNGAPGRCIGTYTGQWRAGQEHGQGKRLWPSGAKYDGQWRNGKVYDLGVFTNTNLVQQIKQHKV